MKRKHPLIVYNTLSRSMEELRPIEKGRVSMFVCGQTVYDDAHLGHAKNYINFDIIARWIRHLGYDLTYAQSITDVDDKIIARAAERGMEPIELAREYEKRFFDDMQRLGVKENVSRYLRSHDYIENIKKQIQLLLDKGYAYPIEQDIYYDVSQFEDYTKLSGMKLDELEKHRIELKEGKRNPYDFALWKGAKKGEPSWEIELEIDGKMSKFAGRPGWHIEDTAMTWALFGEQYDIHGGAKELIFPHHTNEIAQAEAAFGKKPFVRYWLHSGVLTIKGQKMSKSLKNFITIRDALSKFDPEVLRVFVASTQYSNEISYDENLMKEAEKKLHYLYSSMSAFYNLKTTAGKPRSGLDAIITKFKEDFENAMNDNFNTPLALSRLIEAAGYLREAAETSAIITKEEKGNAIEAVKECSGILGVLGKETYKSALPEGAGKLIKERDRLRKEKKFKEADAIRERLKNEFRIGIDDSEFGTIWHYI